MRKALAICLFLESLCISPTALAQAEDWRFEESVTGRSYQVIEAAAAELVRNGLDILRYRIIVTRNETSWFVTFVDADVPDEVRQRVRGSPGAIASFAVELKRDNLQIVHSHFVR
jgi:hypothetical protein